ncbi:MAG: HIRAN domain-containing protein [Verrucomicrobiota bacterium]|nr:HIRAN domain-containing protein [Verrucomicrobiota bacterium]
MSSRSLLRLTSAVLLVLGVATIAFRDFLFGDKLLLYRDLGSDSLNFYYPYLVLFSRYQDCRFGRLASAWARRFSPISAFSFSTRPLGFRYRLSLRFSSINTSSSSPSRAPSSTATSPFLACVSAPPSLARSHSVSPAT